MQTAASSTAPATDRRVPNLKPLDEVSKLIPAFPEATLRDLVYHAEPRLGADGEAIPANGFDVCIVRIGRRVFLDFDRLLDWIEDCRQSRRTRRSA